MKTIVLLLASGLAVLYVLMQFAPQYAVWGEMIVGVSIIIACYVAVDRYLLRAFDTVRLIREGNIAYALLLLAIAVLVLAAAIVVG
ncbi:MAG: hypothetical protein KatS3mg038_2348 [Candidatus Kapaibacterium sp.]|nr:MAG: hypothetical protein KatS3mg038_1102 [Candidatus Kapabacteria bacterium]GIV51827.1 MAG: hypothetical protein KatS3mg038_2348 [Candidatus Kapabacteria bacterium]